MAYLQTSPHAQDPAKCISLFYASHVLKYCTVHNMQAQREYHYNIQLILPSASIYQHVSTLQLTHKKIEGEGLILQKGKREFKKKKIKT